MKRSKSPDSDCRSQPRASGEVRGDVVRLVAVARGRDLDADRPAAGDSAFELIDQRLVVGGGHRRIVLAGREVAHGRRPLPPQQRERHDRQRDGAPAREAQGQYRAAEERAEPRGVRPDLGVDDEQHDADGGVDQDAGAQHPLLGRQQEERGGGEQRHRQERREDEREVAAGRERETEQGDRHRARPTARRAPRRRRPVTASAPPAIATKSAATGLPSPDSAASTVASAARPRWAASRAPRPIAVPSANVRRFAISIVAVATPNHRIADPRAIPVAPVRDRGEQGRARDDGDRPDQARPEPGAEGREEDAVGQQVVTRVPVVVPEQEPVRVEEVRAEGLRREVDAWTAPGPDRRRRGSPPRPPRWRGGRG